MSKPAARVNDFVKHDQPHCHAKIHPVVPPTNNAHDPIPFLITGPGSPNVTVVNQPVVRAMSGDKTVPCTEPTCVTAKEATMLTGSTTVMVNGFPCCRREDEVLWPTCISADIPSPQSHIKIVSQTTVIVGG